MSPPADQTPSPPSFPLRAAAIDIGSNAIRFAAAELRGPRDYRVFEAVRVPVRLGHCAFLTKRLEPGLIDQAVVTLAGFRERMVALGVEHHRAVATSAVRESVNRDELIDRVAERTGIRIEPITGIEEGRLVWQAITSRVELEGDRWLLADLGGGSLEVTLVEPEGRGRTDSLQLGTVRMLERIAGATGDHAGGDQRAPRRALEEHADLALAALPAPPQVRGVLATGGNAEVLATLAGAPRDQNGVRRIELAWLEETVGQLASLSVADRIARFQLPPDRADIILPAAIVYARLAAVVGASSLIIPGVGLKEGVLLDLADGIAGP